MVEFFPWPPMNGGQIRLATALEALADLGELDLLVLCDPDHAAPIVPDGLEVWRMVTTPYPVADWSGWRAKWLLHRGVPVQVALRSGDPTPRKAFASLAAESPDLVWFSSARMFEWMGRPQACPTVVDLIDLEDVKETQRARLIRTRPTAGIKDIVHRVLAEVQARLNASDWRHLQLSVAADVDRVLLSSQLDARRLGAPNAEVVENTIPRSSHPVGKDSVGEPVELLFQATFDYEPNIDGARWLTSEVAPLIRREIPGARIRLVGHVTATVAALDHPPEVSVVGQVPSMEPELARADLVVVPIRFGSGTRLKILEAFAHRVPVVSTSIGAEGLHAEDGVHLLIADDPVEFAAACKRLCSTPPLRRRLVDAAEQLYLQRYTASSATTRVQELARELVPSAPSPTQDV
ncbi:MAG TPA: glycosyltransferase family 4 protein [Acidimicrobiales bacterium]